MSKWARLSAAEMSVAGPRNVFACQMLDSSNLGTKPIVKLAVDLTVGWWIRDRSAADIIGALNKSAHHMLFYAVI